MPNDRGADEPLNGVFRRPSTQQMVVVLDGAVVAACSLALPPEAMKEWYRRVIRHLTPEELVKVLSACRD